MNTEQRADDTRQPIYEQTRPQDTKYTQNIEYGEDTAGPLFTGGLITIVILIAIVGVITFKIRKAKKN